MAGEITFPFQEQGLVGLTSFPFGEMDGWDHYNLQHFALAPGDSWLLIPVDIFLFSWIYWVCRWHILEKPVVY